MKSLSDGDQLVLSDQLEPDLRRSGQFHGMNHLEHEDSLYHVPRSFGTRQP